MEEHSGQWLVYVIRSPTERRYIGITSTGMRERWRHHVRVARTATNRPLPNSIRKYGAESFVVSILRSGLSKQQAQRLERWLILLTKPQMNCTSGGEADGPDAARAFHAARAADAERDMRYRALLSDGCRGRDARNPELVRSRSDAALTWREKNLTQAKKMQLRASRVGANKIRQAEKKDPRFERGRLFIDSEKVRRARESYNKRRSLRTQWAERDQTARSASISKTIKAQWEGFSEDEKEARRAQLALARSSIQHTDEVKERRREGIRRYWAAKRAEKLSQHTTS